MSDKDEKLRACGAEGTLAAQAEANGETRNALYVRRYQQRKRGEGEPARCKGGRPRHRALGEGESVVAKVSQTTGQPWTVMPLAVIRALGLEAGDKVRWTMCGDAAVVERVVNVGTPTMAPKGMGGE